MASASELHRRHWRRSCRRRARRMRYSLLVSVSVMVMVLFLLGVGALAADANGRRKAVGSGAGAGADAGANSSEAKAGLGATGSDIITITGKNFKETIKEGTWFVKFYTDWCKHCKRVQPTWEELATELKGKVNVGEVNCDKDAALCRRFHVGGYPTLVHVHKRRARVYTKSRSKEAMVKFALEGYKKQLAISMLKSPFGPLENFKALVVRGILRAKDFALVQIETGTPVWMVCLWAVAMLVVVTVVVAVVVVSAKRPKQD